MKTGNPEGGGVEGQGFFSGARDKLRQLTQYPESTEPTREQRAAAEQQQKQETLKEQYERSQSPEAQAARDAQTEQYMKDFDRMAETRTDQQVDQLLRASNTDVSEGTLRGDAYRSWKQGRARQAVEAATASDNVVLLDDRRKENLDEAESVEATLAD